MRYTITINQLAIVKNNINLKLEEVILLDYVYWLCGSPVTKKYTPQGSDKAFTWFSYKFFIKENPLITWTSKSTLTSKLKTLETEGFITSTTSPDSPQKKYVRILPKTELLYTDAIKESSQTVHKTVQPGEQQPFTLVNVYNNNKNNIGERPVDASPPSDKETTKEKTETWKLNQKWIEAHKEEFKSSPYKIPENGPWDWRYVLNEGKGLSPDKLFIAYYWREKEKLSQGIYNYTFPRKDLAVGCMMSEKSIAVTLASMLTIDEFLEKIKIVDSLAFDDGEKYEYDYEWKLTTILKNIHRT